MAGLFAAASGCHADEWVIDASVAGRLSYNDNIVMRADDKQGDTYLNVTPAMVASSRTESRDLGLSLGLGGNWYQRRSQYNATDYSARATGKWLVELDQLTLAASSARDSTLQSELASTGIVTSRRQRTVDSLQGSWSRSLGETWSGSLGYGDSRVKYESGPGLVNYEDELITTALRNSLSERAAVSLDLSTRDYRTDNGDVRSQVDAVSLGSQWQWSERMSISLDVGRQWTDTEQKWVAQTLHSKTTGTTYAGTADYQTDSGRLGVSLNRGITASGVGTLLRTSAGGLTFGHRFDEAWSMNLNAGQTRSRYLSNQSADSRYTSIGASLSCQLDERLALGISYNHSRQRTGSQPTVSGNLVFVALNWNAAPISRGW